MDQAWSITIQDILNLLCNWFITFLNTFKFNTVPAGHDDLGVVVVVVDVVVVVSLNLIDDTVNCLVFIIGETLFKVTLDILLNIVNDMFV